MGAITKTIATLAKASGSAVKSTVTSNTPTILATAVLALPKVAEVSADIAWDSIGKTTAPVTGEIKKTVAKLNNMGKSRKGGGGGGGFNPQLGF